MGAALTSSVFGVAAPARGAALKRGRAGERGSALVQESARGAHGSRRAAAAPCEFLGNIEGGDVRGGPAEVVVTDGFTGNVALKLIEGVSSTVLGAVREAAGSSLMSEAWRRADAAFTARRSPVRSTPRRQGGAYLLGLRSLGVVPHGKFTQERVRRARSCARERGARERLADRTHAALDAAGALRVVRRLSSERAGASASGQDAAQRNEDQGPGAGADPGPPRGRARPGSGEDRARARASRRIWRPTRSTSTPWSRSSRTTMVIKISDEEAAQILTVKQAVDFVLAHRPSGSQGSRRDDTRSATCESGSAAAAAAPISRPGLHPRLLDARGAATHTIGSPSSATACSRWP